jgi:hypothetical protein
VFFKEKKREQGAFSTLLNTWVGALVNSQSTPEQCYFFPTTHVTSHMTKDEEKKEKITSDPKFLTNCTASYFFFSACLSPRRPQAKQQTRTGQCQHTVRRTHTTPGRRLLLPCCSAPASSRNGDANCHRAIPSYYTAWEDSAARRSANKRARRGLTTWRRCWRGAARTSATR